MKSNIKELDELIRIPFKGDSKKYLKKISDLIQDIEQIEPKETYSNFLFRVDNAKSTKKYGLQKTKIILMTLGMPF